LVIFDPNSNPAFRFEEWHAAQLLVTVEITDALLCPLKLPWAVALVIVTVVNAVVLVWHAEHSEGIPNVAIFIWVPPVVLVLFFGVTPVAKTWPLWQLEQGTVT
jgi:hypothetical protein